MNKYALIFFCQEWTSHQTWWWMQESRECCHFFWTMKQNHRNQQEKQPSLATAFGYIYLYPINTRAASKQGYNCHSLCKKMISCTTLITHSEVERNQNRFSWNNTRMWFHTSVIVFSAVNVQQRCVQPRDGKYRSRDLCSIWSNPVTSKGRGGGHGRTRSELRWLTLIRELAGTTLVWAHFILWAGCCHRSAQNESQHRDSRYFAWLRKKKKNHLHGKLCLHSYQEVWVTQYAITGIARPKKKLLISFNLKRDRTGSIWYTTMTALFVNTDHVLLPIIQF